MLTQRPSNKIKESKSSHKKSKHSHRTLRKMRNFSTPSENASGQILIGPFQAVIVPIETLSGPDFVRRGLKEM